MPFKKPDARCDRQKGGSPGLHSGEISTEEDMKTMERRRKKRNAAYIFPARGLPPPPEAIPG